MDNDRSGELLKSKQRDESEIQKFYAGQTILITGSTGFMGKLIVEKILRGCPEVRKLYLIIRPKKGVRVSDRLKKYFENPVFETVIGANSNITDKLEAIEGDLTMPDVGLSPKDRRALITETDIIIHNAAVTGFLEKVNVHLKVNALGVKAILDLANECKRLKTFVYVSTAFVQSHMQTLDEKIYPMPVDVKTIHDMIKADTDNANGLSKEVVKSLIGDWPNVYTFTKAFGEMLVDEYSKRSTFQCCILRPSIVMSTWKEPVEGWTGNKGGLGFSIIGNGLGVLRAIHVRREDILTDVVPGDLSINNILAVPWYAAVHRKNVRGETMVFNCGTSTCNPVTIRSSIIRVTELTRENPSRNALWYSNVTQVKHAVTFKIMLILLHILPSVIVDAILLLRGSKPFVTKMVRNYIDGIILVLHFANGDFRIDITNLKRMWDSLNEADRELFQCDLRCFEWNNYFSLCWKGVKKNLLNEPAIATEETKRRYFKLKMLHYSTVFFLSLLLMYFSYSTISYILSFLWQ